MNWYVPTNHPHFGLNPKRPSLRTAVVGADDGDLDGLVGPTPAPDAPAGPDDHDLSVDPAYPGDH